MKYIFIALLLLALFSSNIHAAVDPLSFPNNRFGMGTLSPEADIKEISKLINSNNGDWGYVVLTITKKERDLKRWQNILNTLNKAHLIPIVRIATGFNNNSWDKPSENDANEWVDFLSKLNYPTDNKYIQIYNEVNSGSEWGGRADPKSYAIELNKTIDLLKQKDLNFFVLNAPLDLALPTTANNIEAETFFKQMEEAVPGIFFKIDGLASHSYPNPNFSSNPNTTGRTSIQGYDWELSILGKYNDNKRLPVFITETGWKRASLYSDGLSDETIASYFQFAYSKIWNDPRIVTVAPFIFNYPELLFNQFSFKKNNSINNDLYHSYYYAVQSLLKTKGEPKRTKSVEFNFYFPEKLLINNRHEIILNIKNTGNYIIEGDELNFNFSSLGANIVKENNNKSIIFPGESTLFKFFVESEIVGDVTFKFNINGDGLDSYNFFKTIRSESTLTLVLNIISSKLNSFY